MNLSDLQTLLCVLCLLLAPLAGAGLALINTGLGRSRNAAHSMMTALCVVAVAACAYIALGRCWSGSAAPFFSGLPVGGSPAYLKAWMGIVSVSLAGLIPLGSGAERWRLTAAAASAALLAGVTVPIFMRWAWDGGWLAQLGYVDAGGSGVIQAAGGLTALAIAWILGARRGKYGNDGMPMAIPGHGAVLVLFGCMLSLSGWIALNGAGAILFAGAEPGRMSMIAVDTIAGAAASALAAALITGIRYGRPDASLTANGWIGGLVATSAGCAFLPPAAAILVGLVAGALVTFSVELLELKLGVDDPGGSVSVHAIAGLWGVIAAGLLGRFPAGPADHLLGQVVGVATLLGFVFPLSWGMNWLLNRLLPMRVSRDGERQGLDLFELGAGAYPDFVTHTDEFMQR